jgi:hypothetical membrane protein
MFNVAQETKNSLFESLAGLCGILGSILPLIFVLSATFLSTWFSWNENALSELGKGEQAILFNSAMLVGGALNFLFGLGLYKHLGREKLSRGGVVLIMLSSVCLALVGLFTIDYHIPHGLVALGYFLLAPIGFLLVGFGEKENRIRNLSFACGVVALMAILGLPAIVLVLSLNVGFAVPELVEGLIISAWTIYMSARLLKRLQAKLKSWPSN